MLASIIDVSPMQKAHDLGPVLIAVILWMNQA